MPLNVSRKIKSLEYSIEHLKLEIDELSEEMSEYSSSFMKELYETADINSTTCAKSSEAEIRPPDADSILDKQVQPDDLKKIWKKIAAVTHPDKTGNNPRLTSLYKRAAAAWQSLHAQDLIQVAAELGLETPQIARETTLFALTGLEKNLRLKLKDLESSVLIQWGREKDPNVKKDIMDFYFQAKGIARK